MYSSSSDSHPGKEGRVDRHGKFHQRCSCSWWNVSCRKDYFSKINMYSVFSYFYQINLAFFTIFRLVVAKQKNVSEAARELSVNVGDVLEVGSLRLLKKKKSLLNRCQILIYNRF